MKDFRSCFKALLGDLRPNLSRLSLGILLGLTGVFTSLAFVWISKRLVDIATGHLDAPIGPSAWTMVGIIALQVLCRVAARYWEGYMVMKHQNASRAEMFGRVMRSSWDGRDRFHSGDVINRLEMDVQTVTEFIFVNVTDFIVTVVQLVAATAYLFRMAPTMAWYLIFIMPVAVVGSRLFFKKMRQLTSDIRRCDSRVQEHMQESLQHRILVRTLGATSLQQDKLDGIQDELQGKVVSRLNYAAVSRGFMNVGFSAGYLLVFLWGVTGLKSGTVTYGMMVAFLQLVSQVQRPVADIARHIPAFIRALSSEERLMELSEAPSEDADDEKIMFTGAPGIRVSGVGFAYPGQRKPVLDNLCFDFKPGTMTAITGPTGIGKSTLIKLVLSVLKPSDGCIEIYDSERTQEVSGATLCNFMYVPQGNSLMSGTIRSNLLLGNPSADEQMMKDALHTAAADFVMDLPDGLDTSCSEVGRGLSEGQAQRIAIARALIHEGGILILDEATSALDADTESELLARVSRNCRGGKTILCITHRPAATTLSDAVLEIG